MCLEIDIIKHGVHDSMESVKNSAFITEEDFKVYKAFTIITGKICTSFLAYGVSDKGETMKSIFTFSKIETTYKIEMGIHAYTEKDSEFTKRHLQKWNMDFIIECVIPKGAKYFFGKKGDIVTDTLIVPSVKEMKKIH